MYLRFRHAVSDLYICSIKTFINSYRAYIEPPAVLGVYLINIWWLFWGMSAVVESRS